MRCFLTAPWAPDEWQNASVDPGEWPDIWVVDGEGLATADLTAAAGGQEHDADGRVPDRPPEASWPLGRALSAVAVLIGLAEISALYAPQRLLGLVSLVILGGTALLVVRRAWPDEASGAGVDYASPASSS
ncbi:MAG: hypothetical protein ABR518_08205 [Actinomycetota bacterium]